ncbi:MAG: PAS domain S-box protein [Desulfobacteraceae bacterium]|nr:PAS domain S-box protein [Desulfobacteraceae bacterium]
MPIPLAELLTTYQSEIIHRWVRLLHSEGGKQYAARPKEELYNTVSQAYAANYEFLVFNNLEPINQFIDKITRMRLEAGFMLSDVQKAFELFRNIIIPLLLRHGVPVELNDNIAGVNNCLAYTIHQFSDYFQMMHEKQILEQNRQLEETVTLRTSALEESQKKYKTLVEEINDGYFVVQKEVIVFANQAFCRMHNYGPSQVTGKKFIEFVAGPDREKVQGIYRKSLVRDPVPRVFEYRRLTRNGQTFPTEIQAKRTRFDHKISNIGICRDITGRVRMEARVRENERMAYIGHITTSLSHEIRNPLSAVKLNLQILAKNTRIKGNDRRRIRISTDEVIRLEKILNQLLDFAKPIRLNRSPERLERITADFTELLEMQFREKQLTVETLCDPDMPDVPVDREKFGQAVINVLLNAIDASAAGDVISIRTRYVPDRRRSRAEILFEDQGQGFSPQIKEELFKPFFTTKSKGSGLGLSNVKRIIEAHGGWVEAIKRASPGAAFKICLPIE